MNWVSIVSIVISLVALGVTLRREFFVIPKIEYTTTELTEYPRSDLGLSLRVKRAEVEDYVLLKYGVLIYLRSTGREPASNVQVRVRANGDAVIVQAHTDDSLLVERLPDIGRQGSEEVFLTIPLMVPGEAIWLTFWYGVPGSTEKTPLPPTVLVRHARGLGRSAGSI